jgi:hypothetical protein
MLFDEEDDLGDFADMPVFAVDTSILAFGAL